MALAAAFCFGSTTASALNPDHDEANRQRRIGSEILFEQMLNKPAALESGAAGLSASPVIAAFLRLFPNYRAADQPLCREQRPDDSVLRYNRVKFLYTAQAGNSVAPAVIELAVSPIGAANAFTFPAVHSSSQQAGIPQEGSLDFEEEAPRIVLTDGLIRKRGIANGEAALAFAIGHEVGHLVSGHLPLTLSGFVVSPEQQARITEIERQWEFEADKFAAELMYQRGFNPAAVKAALLSVARGERAEASGSHPKFQERLEKLGFSIPPGPEMHQNNAQNQSAELAAPRAVSTAIN